MTNADKITDFALGKLQAVFDGVSHALPTVTKYALQVTSMNCLVNVLTGLICLVFTGLFGYVAFRTGKKSNEECDGWFFMALLAGIGTITLGIGTVIQLFDIWSWIGIWHPDLYLIHLALQKVTG